MFTIARCAVSLFLLIRISLIQLSAFKGSLIAQMKGNRVKRAWKYPDITIAEQFEGAPFQPKVIAEVRKIAKTITFC